MQHVTAVCWCVFGGLGCLCCSVRQSITAVVDKMKAAGAPVELFMYEHCGHAFMNALTKGGREKIKGGLTSNSHVMQAAWDMCPHDFAVPAT